MAPNVKAREHLAVKLSDGSQQGACVDSCQSAAFVADSRASDICKGSWESQKGKLTNIYKRHGSKANFGKLNRYGIVGVWK